jgi:hypothetical protein
MAHVVGGEVDGFCTKCRMILAHTVLAMVGERVARVKCNTCGGEHAYKASEPSATSVRASRPKTTTPKIAGARTRAQEVSFDEELAKKDAANAKPYVSAQKFAVGDLVNHPSFGLGIVAASRSDKIDVTFRSFVKTLLHGRTGPSAPLPTYTRPPPPRPSEAAEAAADAEALAAGDSSP